MQTFDGHHAINSGVITLDLKVVPHGSSTIRGPIELAFGGPFTNAGAGKVPESDFTISISAEGHRGALEVISAGGRGYIKVGGQSYRMPASSYRSLSSGLGSLASSGSAGNSRQGAFSALGIKPLRWLRGPRIVGRATIAGVATTQVQAQLDPAAMVRDFSRLLGRTGSLGVSSSALPKSISAQTQGSIAHALGSPSFDLWTGVSDKLMRKLTVSATVPVSGPARTALGGMRSAVITLSFEYRQVNQPQTITVPAVTKPYSVFRAQVTAVLQEIEGGLLSGSLGTGSLGTATGTTTAGAYGGSAADQKYAQCITAAKGEVAKMQKCSKLLATG